MAFPPVPPRTVAHAAAIAVAPGARLLLLHVIEPLLVQAAAMKYDTTYLRTLFEADLLWLPHYCFSGLAVPTTYGVRSR